MSHDVQSTGDLFTAQQKIVVERFYILLATLHPLLHQDVVRALRVESKLLSPQVQPKTDSTAQHTPLPAGVWALLPFLIAQHISPEIDPIVASSVAVAVECYVCALDLLDDIEDEDQTPVVQELGSPRVLNVSTTLLMLAEHALLSLAEQGVAPIRVLGLLDTLHKSALIATSGQHRDLLAERMSLQDITQEECIEIAAAKAGSIMSLACRLGAMCAGGSDQECEQFAQLGTLLGIAHQLDNDAHDLYYLLQGESTVQSTSEAEITRSKKTDLLRSKKTLPIVLAARVHTIANGASYVIDTENKESLRLLQEGIIATWGICQLYRERARDRLQEIEAKKPAAPTLLRLLNF